MISFKQFLSEAKKEITIDDIDDNLYYTFKVFHKPQNREMGSVKKKGKELKTFLKSDSYVVSKIKCTTSPMEDKLQH